MKKRTIRIPYGEGHLDVEILEIYLIFGGHPEFEFVERCGGPEEILDTIRFPGFFMDDQWEAQVLARVLTRCDVVFVTSG